MGTDDGVTGMGVRLRQIGGGCVLRTVLAALALGLIGCTDAGQDAQIAALPAPAPPVETAMPQPRPARSPASEELARYYARVQSDLLARGLLRTDGGGPDTPFGTRQLVENFERIALYDEYVSRGSALVLEQTPSRLRRWDKPVRMQLTFGPSIPDEVRRKDTAAISAYAARLARLTGHPISVTDRGGNFQILILNEDERQAYGPQLRALVPGIDDQAVEVIQNMPRGTFCQVLALYGGTSSTYSNAVAVIRGEHPDLLRQLCLHEELAQGLGLANDSPAARPSIFNDDEEFALLTRQDELMLRILYDPRLSPGLSADQARPIVQTIATELLGDR